MKPKPSISTVLGFAAALLATAGFTSNVAAQGTDSARQEKMRADLQKRFTAADTNADGRLSRDEAKGGMPRVYRNFDAIDAEKTGVITLEQIVAFASRQGGRS
ncbi:MAG: EF-hand domain-containing protein [Gammaproteobacteria bacterium]|nr:EF-hand domain-containing protein [Gammaproteobacteria bacterium]MBU0826992.1 EF-hand domain-containing protein [Gammaproteobacteria bacterium]MBU0893154.1 EF-hand domain-containing protein [Gammaproteobacteria bacterium]MBU1818040.1 EF-hand domain-containing protein [Gammaproteobacteria bacterium]